jgi:hypothetical protein
MTGKPGSAPPARPPVKIAQDSAIPRTNMNIPPPPKPSTGAPATAGKSR